ncbi:MAG: hypothetical protein AAF670_19775, partial [Planctomycetota bacterium]
AFQFAFVLGIVQTRSHMRHTAVPDKRLEITCDDPRSVIADESRLHTRMSFRRGLANDLDIQFGHRFPSFVMHDVSAVAVENRDKEKELPARVDVGNVHVPVLVSLERMIEAVAFSRLLVARLIQATNCFEHSVDRRRSHCRDIFIEHHERQPSVTIQRIVVVKIDNGLLSQS